MALSPSSSSASTTTTTTSSRRLLVPAADVLAKNMRATEAQTADATGTRKKHAPAPGDAGAVVAPSFLMGLGAVSESNVRQQANRSPTKHRFQSATALAAAEKPPGLLTRLLRGRAVKTAAEEAQQRREKEEKDAKEKEEKKKSKQKLLTMLSKVSNIVSKLPSPFLQLFVIVLSHLALIVVRPKLADLIYVKIALVMVLNLILLQCTLYKKSTLFTMIRDEQYVLSHSTEHRLDKLEADIARREVRVNGELSELAKNEAKLDELRKEFARDGNAINEDGQIIPTRRAAEMIVAGALGAGFDERTAAQVEARRKEENMKKSREEWRQRAELDGEDETEMKHNLKMLADHAAAAYKRRTKDVKTNLDVSNTSTSSSGLNNAAKNSSDAFKDFKRKMQENAVVRVLDNVDRRVSRHSERSVPVARSGLNLSDRASTSGRVPPHSPKERDTSTASRRRITMFRRRRRETAPELDSRLTMSEAGGSASTSSNRRRR